MERAAVIRFLALALALSVYAGSPAAARPQTSPDLAERESIVRERFIPAFVAGLRPPLEASWDHFPADEVHPDELAASRAAHERNVDELVERAGSRAGAIILKHVPLDQLLADDNVDTPEWQAAIAELMTMVQDGPREGVELSARVIEVGCRVRTNPSPTCADRLAMVADYRAGRLTMEDLRPE
jgi:hypothetical protein